MFLLIGELNRLLFEIFICCFGNCAILLDGGNGKGTGGSTFLRII